MRSRALPIASLVALVGCATSRPVLYPNAHYQSVAAETVQRDVAECRNLAEAAGARQQTAEAARVGTGTAVGAGIGAAGGAAGGAVSGAPGVGALVGAVGGAVAGLLGSVFSRPSKPDPVYRSFVERCLRERGYEPTGWQ
jgi:hypothetical protein